MILIEFAIAMVAFVAFMLMGIRNAIRGHLEAAINCDAIAYIGAICAIIAAVA